MYRSPVLLTDKGHPDTTARAVLVVLAEHAGEDGKGARPSVLRIRFASGYNDRTVQRAIARLESNGLIIRTGTWEDGVAVWSLAMHLERPETVWTDLCADVDNLRITETAARTNRRIRSRTASLSGTQNPGHSDEQISDESPRSEAPEVPVSDLVRDAESTCPGRRIPDVRDATPPEPPTKNHPLTTPGGTLPPDPLGHEPPTESRHDQTQSSSAPQDQPSEVISNSRPHTHKERAIGVARVPRPTRCPHGQPLTHRPDLTPRCTLCHRTATLTEPTGPLATVIPLHPRTA